MDGVIQSRHNCNLMFNLMFSYFNTWIQWLLHFYEYKKVYFCTLLIFVFFTQLTLLEKCACENQTRNCSICHARIIERRTKDIEAHPLLTPEKKKERILKVRVIIAEGCIQADGNCLANNIFYCLLCELQKLLSDAGNGKLHLFNQHLRDLDRV